MPMPYRAHHRKPLTKRSKVWVTVYDVVMEYGGPEEGGWYFPWYTPLWTRQVPARVAARVRDEQYARWSKKWGRVMACIDRTKHGRQTRRRPRYE